MSDAAALYPQHETLPRASEQKVFLTQMTVFPTTFDVSSAAAVSDRTTGDVEDLLDELTEVHAIVVGKQSDQFRLFLLDPGLRRCLVAAPNADDQLLAARERHRFYFLRDFSCPTSGDTRHLTDDDFFEFRRANLEVAAMNQIRKVLGSASVKAARASSRRLTRRQWEVAQLVAVGRTNYQIAHELGISEWTAVNHVRSVMRRLACASRVEVARAVIVSDRLSGTS